MTLPESERRIDAFLASGRGPVLVSLQGMTAGSGSQDGKDTVYQIGNIILYMQIPHSIFVRFKSIPSSTN